MKTLFFYIVILLFVANMFYMSFAQEKHHDYQPSTTLATMLGDLSAEAKLYYESLSMEWKKTVDARVQDELIFSTLHLQNLLELNLSTDQLDTVFNNSCFLCHSGDPDVEGPDRFRFYDKSLRQHTRGVPDKSHPNSALDMVNGVHFQRGLSCVGCHGGDDKPENSEDAMDEMIEFPEGHKDKNPFWEIGFCGRKDLS